MPRERKNCQVVWLAIASSRCTGCGWCVAACPDNLLILETASGKKSAQLAIPDLCTGCAKCTRVCNFEAIEIRVTAGTRRSV